MLFAFFFIFSFVLIYSEGIISITRSARAHYAHCCAMTRKLPPRTRIRSDNWKPGQLLVQGFKLACCVDRVSVQARATCSHGDRYDAALWPRRWRSIGYSEKVRIGGWRHVDEKLCFQLSVHSKLELDCIENSCAEEVTLQSNYFHTVLAVQKSAQARPQYS